MRSLCGPANVPVVISAKRAFSRFPACVLLVVFADSRNDFPCREYLIHHTSESGRRKTEPVPLGLFTSCTPFSSVSLCWLGRPSVLALCVPLCSCEHWLLSRPSGQYLRDSELPRLCPFNLSFCCTTSAAY